MRLKQRSRGDVRMHDTPLPPSFTNNLYSHPKFRLVLDKCFKMHILVESAHGEVPKWPKGLPC